MKLSLIAVAVAMMLFPGMSRADDKREAKPRFKGVELYGWKTSDGEWLYVLLDGTNRQKSEKEVKEQKNRLKGSGELKKALALLAEGESVIWGSHRLKGFELPPEAVRKEIAKTARGAKVDLIIDLE